MRSTKEEFIEKAKIVHAGENLDYSEVVYKNNKTPVKIIDHDLDENGAEYGEFWQSPTNHLKGQCHPRKRRKRISLAKREKEDEVIARFKEIHKGENLDYSQVHYVNMHTKVKIISHDLRPDGTEYGEFWQEPAVHLKGCSHPQIGLLKQAESSRYTTAEFIEKAKLVHSEDNYDYSLVDYKRSQEKVIIICPEHGQFAVCPDAFLQGKGCPKCGNHLSRAEDEIVELLSSKLGEENVVQRDKTILEGKELDIYVPSKKIAFEYNGLRWHSEEFNKDKRYHLNKLIECEKKGITLIHIFEDEYLYHKRVVLNKILHLIHCNNAVKIGARKCCVREISKNTAYEFLSKYHIQGYVGSTVYIGMFHHEVLVAVMTFINENNGKWNLSRYATNYDFNCQGGASKILSYFIKAYKPLEIKSFLDYRWCGNRYDNLYTKLGFTEDKIWNPDYRYTNGHGERLHKFNFRKQKMHKKYGFPLSMTETEMAKELGYWKIWDCGLIKYVWKKKNEA